MQQCTCYDMLGKQTKFFAVALAGVVATFFAAKGDKVTQFFAGWTALFAAFTVNELCMVFGALLGFASFILSWVYKQKYLEALRLKEKSAAKGLIEDVER